MSSHQSGRQIHEVECPQWQTPVTINNFMRHWSSHVTGDPWAPQSEPNQERSTSQQQGRTSANLLFDDPNSGNRTSITPSVSSTSIVSAATSTMQYSMAARALLKHTNHYTETGLMGFLGDNYPEIPEGHRHSLVIGAVTGAQTAAQLYILMDGAKSDRDRLSRDMAEGARRMLSLYNIGLMSEDPRDPNPQIRRSPRPPSTPRRREPLPLELPERKEAPKEHVIPAPAEEILSSEEEEGNNTETSTRAIELVELEISGTQLCNRQGVTGGEETASAPPIVDAYHAALARECSFYSSVNERIRKQIELETLEEARAKLREARGPSSQEIPPSPPPQKECRVELPLLLRLPPPPSSTTAPTMPHIPAAVASAAAATMRQAQSSSSGIRSFVPTGKLHPGTMIETTASRPPAPKPSGEASLKIAVPRGTSPRRSPTRQREGSGRRPLSRQQSPTRGPPRHGRSASPRGRRRTSRSRSPDDSDRAKERRERDRSYRR